MSKIVYSHLNLTYKVSEGEVFPPPLAVRATLGDGSLHLLVPDDGLVLHVHQQHSAGPESTFLEDVAWFDVVHSDFRRHHQHVVLGDVVPDNTNRKVKEAF